MYDINVITGFDLRVIKVTHMDEQPWPFISLPHFLRLCFLGKHGCGL